jgi:hypothetical protein
LARSTITGSGRIDRAARGEGKIGFDRDAGFRVDHLIW